MSKQRILIFFFAALIAPSALAQPPLSGSYIGAAYGETELDDDDLFADAVDDEDESYQFWGGYKFNRWFAVEGRYTSLGEYSNIGLLFLGRGSVEVDAVTAHAVFIAPFGGSDFDFYGHVGAGVALYEAKIGRFDDDDEGGIASAGLGFRWTPAPQVTLSIGVDGYAFEVERGDDDFDVAIGTWRFGLQYNF